MCVFTQNFCTTYIQATDNETKKIQVTWEMMETKSHNTLVCPRSHNSVRSWMCLRKICPIYTTNFMGTKCTSFHTLFQSLAVFPIINLNPHPPLPPNQWATWMMSATDCRDSTSFRISIFRIPFSLCWLYQFSIVLNFKKIWPPPAKILGVNCFETFRVKTPILDQMEVLGPYL